MDNYIQNDPLNPINQQSETRFCIICNIEESKTYFVDYDCICENCSNEEEEETNKQIKTINLKL